MTTLDLIQAIIELSRAPESYGQQITELNQKLDSCNKSLAAYRRDLLTTGAMLQDLVLVVSPIIKHPPTFINSVIRLFDSKYPNRSGPTALAELKERLNLSDEVINEWTKVLKRIHRFSNKVKVYDEIHEEKYKWVLSRGPKSKTVKSLKSKKHVNSKKTK